MATNKPWAQERKTRKGTRIFLARWTNPDGTPDDQGGFRTRKAAEDWLATEVTPKLLRGKVFDPNAGKALFRDAAAQWLVSRHKLKPTTLAAYAEALAATTEETAARHKRLAHLRIDNVFGGRPVNTIRRQDVSQWVGRMIDAGKKPSTVRNAYFLVRQVLGQAVADGRLDANPADYVELPTEHNSGNGAGVVDDPAKFLTAAQVAALVAAMPWPFNVYVHTAAWAGLRAGEMAGLRVGDVTKTGTGMVSVERTIARVGRDLVPLQPKTKGSRRRVPLTPQTTTILRDYLAEHPNRDNPGAPLFPSVRLTVSPPSTATFPAPPAKDKSKRQAAALAALSVNEAEKRLDLNWNEPLRHATFYKAVFRPGVLRANLLPDTHPHTLRHTYASLCIAAGIPMFEVSRFMGHSKPSTTETVYAHLLTEDHSGAMAALGGLDVPANPANNVVRLRR